MFCGVFLFKEDFIMHMADALLSPAVGIAMCTVSTGAVAYSVVKINKDELSDKKVPLMAVAGAFVFAAQMINFTIPATGSSGHIGGGILLAALLGGFPSLLTLSTVLIIQALFFADGGLLALGSNIFNMGIIPSLIVYPLIFRPLIKKGITLKRITLASILSVVVGLQLGSLGVVLETYASGIAELPINTFLLMMQPIHLAIGLIEGLVTAAVLGFVYKARPEILESAGKRRRISGTVPMKRILVILGVLAIITAGGLSLYASANPDGLEWSMEKVAGTTEIKPQDKLLENTAQLQEKTALMPDYDYAADSKGGPINGTSAAGIIGGGLTFLVAGIIAFIISRIKNRKATAMALDEN